MASTPQMPHVPCTDTAPTGSSTPFFDVETEYTTNAPATAPVMSDPKVLNAPQPAVIPH